MLHPIIKIRKTIYFERCVKTTFGMWFSLQAKSNVPWEG
jgi:hypothetical protein